jgi:hypothetical protein
MENPDWKTTLKASLISAAIVLSLGYSYIWVVSR